MAITRFVQKGIVPKHIAPCVVAAVQRAKWFARLLKMWSADAVLGDRPGTHLCISRRYANSIGNDQSRHLLLNLLNIGEGDHDLRPYQLIPFNEDNAAHIGRPSKDVCVET